VLTWTGELGFEADGVNPDYGTVCATSFTYKVRYYDADGDEPQYVQLWLYKDGVRVPGSPFLLNLEVGSGNKADGDYMLTLTYLKEPGEYSYEFKAKGKDGLIAEGSATPGSFIGPIVRGEVDTAPPISLVELSYSNTF
jgi:hypothetical protein